DLAERRFDAGIRDHSFIARDMVSVPVSAPSCYLAAASPDYLTRFGTPQSPAELRHHSCILLRQVSGELLPWQFSQGENELAVPADCDLVTNDITLMLEAAIQGQGICYSLYELLQPLLLNKELVPLLEPHARQFAGFAIYFPRRRQMLPALRALIDFLKIDEADALTERS
ncbi:MAG: LysR substrate-binding domain-containing protein, partial [Burkholderiaceae bacterium]